MPVADVLIETCGVRPEAKVLHLGRRKRLLLREIPLPEPALNVRDFDIAAKGIEQSRKQVKSQLLLQIAQ